MDALLVQLGRELGLTLLEQLAIALAAAVEEEPLVGRVLASLQAPTGSSRPTLGLVSMAFEQAAPPGASALHALANGAAHARDAIAELREAQRLALESPQSVVTIGGDETAPMRNATDQMRSFDINMRNTVTSAERNVEVTTARGTAGTATEGYVAAAPDLTAGVQHAGDKLASRIADRAPITGSREAVIRMRFFQGSTPVGRGGRGGIITYDGVGGYSHQPPHLSAPPRPGNILDDFQEALPIIRNNQLLERVRLVDFNGNVIAEFERGPGGWSRRP